MDSKTSMQLIALEAYKEYLGVQLHYSKDDYDFSKFGARKCNLETFQKRGDWNIFYKLIQKYPSKAERVKLMGLSMHEKGTQPCHLMMSGANINYRTALRYEQNAYQTFIDVFYDDIMSAYAVTGGLKCLFDGQDNNLSNAVLHLKNDVVLMAFFDIITGAVTNWAVGSHLWADVLKRANKVKVFLDKEAILKDKERIINHLTS